MTKAPALVALALVAALGAAEAGQKVKLRKPKRGFQMAVTPYLVPPAADLEWCEYRRFPNKEPMDIAGFKLRMPEGAHHFVVWGYNGNVDDDAQFPTDAVEVAGCTGLGPGDTFIPVNLFGMQTPNGALKFPKGIAVRVKAHQQVWLNPHLRNGTSIDVIPDIKFNVIPAKKGSIEHYAESFSIGNASGIHIPAGGTQTLVSEWAAPVPLNLIQLSSHQHQWGTYVRLELEQEDGTFLEVFENDAWEHPYELWTHKTAPWKDLSPAIIRLEQGRRMRFTCKWLNPTDHDVRFGTETSDEMCFVTGYYYRDADTPEGPIVGPGCIPAKESLTCPLAATVSSSE